MKLRIQTIHLSEPLWNKRAKSIYNVVLYNAVLYNAVLYNVVLYNVVLYNAVALFFIWYATQYQGSS